MIGSSTGYTQELMEIVAPIAALRGYAPDVMVCADDVPAGRPAPWLNILNLGRLQQNARHSSTRLQFEANQPGGRGR